MSDEPDPPDGEAAPGGDAEPAGPAREPRKDKWAEAMDGYTPPYSDALRQFGDQIGVKPLALGEFGIAGLAAGAFEQFQGITSAKQIVEAGLLDAGLAAGAFDQFQGIASAKQIVEAGLLDAGGWKGQRLIDSLGTPPWSSLTAHLDLDHFLTPALAQIKELNSQILGLTRTSLYLPDPPDTGIQALADVVLGDMRRLWADLRPTARDLLRFILPPNLRELDDVEPADVLQLAEDAGIPLYLTPRASIARSLLKAKSPQDQRSILNRKFDAVLDDCEGVLDNNRSEPFAKFALEAMQAARDGHYAAAQALATNTLDSVLGLRLAAEDSDLAKHRKKSSPDRLREAPFEIACVFMPIWKCHETYRPAEGDPIPYTYSRHGSVHGVSTRQFSKRNTLHSLMLLTSLIGLIPRLDHTQHLERRRTRAG